MARRVRVGAGLAPTRHAAIDEARVARKTVVGPDAETFRDAWAESLDEHVGLLDEVEHRGDALGVLEIDADRASAPGEDIEPCTVGGAATHAFRSVDAKNVGAQIGEHHGAERPRADSRDLENLQSVQRSAHDTPPVMSAADRPTEPPTRRAVYARMYSCTSVDRAAMA